MATWTTSIEVRTPGRGLHSFTSVVERALVDAPKEAGLLHLFLKHTSASLLIQENADPTARQDLETFLERLAPEGESWYRHLTEGPDDTVSHLRAAITPTFLILPVRKGRMHLGTWQGLYVWEHRRTPRVRKIELTFAY